MITIYSEFEDHLKESFPKRNLSGVQKIVEFYFWYRELNKKYEPYTRHLKVAKKINNWADGDMHKVIDLIITISSYMDSRNLQYNLDTVYKNIPNYEKEKNAEREAEEMSNDEYRRTRELLEKYGRHKEPDEDDETLEK